MIRTPPSPPPHIAEARLDPARAQFAADLRYYLSQDPRQLPSRYLYDELGSALFEAICRLPWYRITRAEERLLSGCRADLFRRLPTVTGIVELGSGSGEKLKTLLDAPALDVDALSIHLVDLSPAALDLASRTLASLGLRVIPHQTTYESGIVDAARQRDVRGALLVVFLGSNIGNFDPPASNALLQAIRRELRSGDALLLGADLIKPERKLLLAYDDPLGVTAAFNRNLLVRINRELGGNFDIEQFAHRAIWNAPLSRVEMHLMAQTAQRVHVSAAQIEVPLEAGEMIWTESSYKYRLEDIDGLLAPAGFRVVTRWVDEADGFALTLAAAV